MRQVDSSRSLPIAQCLMSLSLSMTTLVLEFIVKLRKFERHHYISADCMNEFYALEGKYLQSAVCLQGDGNQTKHALE